MDSRIVLAWVLAVAASACGNRAEESREEIPAAATAPEEASAEPAEPAEPAPAAATATDTDTDTATDTATDTDTDTAAAPATDPALPTPGTFVEAGGVRLTSLSTCTGVESRECINPKSEFIRGVDPRLYVHIRLDNIAREATQLGLAYVRRGDPAPTEEMPVTLDIAEGRRFTTWAFIPVRRAPGDYDAVVTATDGTELGRVPFTIVAAPAAPAATP